MPKTLEGFINDLKRVAPEEIIEVKRKVISLRRALCNWN
jgi:hypothetical protein